MYKNMLLEEQITSVVVLHINKTNGSLQQTHKQFSGQNHKQLAHQWISNVTTKYDNIQNIVVKVNSVFTHV